MPELPEVETTRRGIVTHLSQQQVLGLIIRQKQLRWRISDQLGLKLVGAVIHTVTRRGKYLLVHASTGTLLIHLGMSGHLRILSQRSKPGKHDHIDLELANHKILRYTDPRRFGAWVWTEEDPYQHPLLAKLGPEPFDQQFNPIYLQQLSRQRSVSIKPFIMDNHTVVGVGNIYANEALFLAGLHPTKPAKQITAQQYQLLVAVIQQVLAHAIALGGTTIRNFLGSAGSPGYFKQQLWVYGRAGQPCKKCQTVLAELRLGQRSSVFCPACQQL